MSTPQVEISVTKPAGRVAGRVSPLPWSRQSELNDLVAKIVVAILALVPLPLGSNRAFFWGLTATIVGATCAYYARGLGKLNERFHYSLRHLFGSLILLGLLCAFLVAQTLPIGLLRPLLHLAGLSTTIVTQFGATLDPSAISLAPGATWLMLMRMVTYSTFFWLVLQIAANYRRKTFLLQAVVVIVTFYAALGLVSLAQFGDTILGLPKLAYLGSATGPFLNRNSFATFLAFGAIVSLTLAASKMVRRSSAGDDDQPATTRGFDPIALVYLLAFAAIMSTLWATNSRAGLFSGLAGCATVLAFTIFRARGGFGGVVVLLGLTAAVFGLGVYAYGHGLIDRLGSLEQAADVRTDLYKQVWQMIMLRPFTGYGGGAFESAFPLFHQLPVSVDLVWDHAHNSYLGLWVELGLVAGSIPILLFLGSAGKIAWGLRNSRSDWTAKVVALGVMVTGGMHSLFDFSLEIQANTMLFVAIIAMGTAGIAQFHRPKA